MKGLGFFKKGLGFQAIFYPYLCTLLSAFDKDIS